MITTTNKQILSVDFAKKWKEEAEYDKALVRMGAKKNLQRFVAKSPNYAIISTEHFGIYLLKGDEINEVLNPLTANEYKALDFCFQEVVHDREDVYCTELKRLRSLPIQTKKIEIDGLDCSAEFVFDRTCDRWSRVEGTELPTYIIEYNEDFSKIENKLKEFGIKCKEVE